jgi:hemolysin activation/secretion protein
MFHFHLRGAGMGLFGLAIATAVHAQTAQDLATQQLQLQEQRERALREQAAASQPDVRLTREPAATGLVYPEREAPCFPISQIKLEGEDAGHFAWALAAANDARGRCLGSAGINVVLARVQNALIDKGYVTTRVVAAPQDLTGGTLVLVVVPGRIRAVRFAPAEGTAVDAAVNPTHYWNTLPAGPGDLVNLRDVEQALENFKRVPTAEADIKMVPGSAPGESDLLVQWRQSRPLRVSVSVDDSGSDATGKYQGNATLSLDNPFGLQDLFYVSLSNDLNGNSSIGTRGTRGHSLHYSVPYGYWLLALSGNDYTYRQSVAGSTQNYVYSGTSRNLEVKLSRVLYRDAVRKVGAFMRGYQRNSHNYIDDTQVEVQQRQMGGFELGLTDREFIGKATLDASFAYKRGTGAFGTLAAPEEAFGEGTSRPRILTADLGLALPFELGGSRFDYQGSLRAQWNRSTLIAQDRFAIGGRYTVRGFDGESSLSAERGWLTRNELGWSPAGTRQQLYLAVDYAKVAGPSAAYLLGTRLGGAALGLRGQLLGLQYDLFAGRPFAQPAHFQTAAIASGFSISYQY